MKDMMFTVDKQRELKKELITMKWDSPTDAAMARVLLDRFTGMFNYGFDKDSRDTKTILEEEREMVNKRKRWLGE